MRWGDGATGRLAGVAEIGVMLNVHRSRADQLSRQRGFPDPYDVLAADTPRPQRIWLRTDVERWAAENPRPPKKPTRKEAKR